MLTKPKAVKRIIAEKVEALIQSAPSALGLPSNIFIVALDGYESHDFSFAQINQRRKAIEDTIRASMPESLIASGYRRSMSQRRQSAAVMVYHPKTAPMGNSTFFSSYCQTFLFERTGVVFLHTMEPVATTQHLHERMLQRSSSAFRNFVEAQDALSVLWPALIELGNYRRAKGEKANVTFFVSPWDNGLMFGDFSVMDEMREAAPRITEFRDSIGVESYLYDFYSQGNRRALAMIRTFIGHDEMKPHQARLKMSLDDFVSVHREVLDFLKWKPRLGLDTEHYDHNKPRDIYPNMFAHTLGIIRPGESQFESMINELDKITSSDDWLYEAAFSKQNRTSQR